MAVIKVRTRPIDIFYLTGDDAKKAAEASGDGRVFDACFCTVSMGHDGFTWDTPEEFESDYALSFGGEKLPDNNGNPLETEFASTVEKVELFRLFLNL